jgi:hypothetical protein
VPGVSVCCATAPAHLSPWTGCASSIRSARPHAATLAAAPARKCDDKGAEQPLATETRRLTHPTDPNTIRLA